MLRLRAVAPITVLLAVLAVLSVTVPAGAHTALPAAAEVLRTPSVDVRPTVDTVPVDTGALASPVGLSSLLLVAIALGIIAAVGLSIEGARRHPRQALVLALGLLLAIFAFENGVHSVHHGFDAKQYDECTIAAASAHLSAISVDGVLETSVVLIAIDRTADFDPAAPPTRQLEPDQGRAPPLATA
jgi:hypothetical protein